MSSIKEQGDLFWTLTRQVSQSKWSSQEWKSDELTEVRTGRPVYEQPPGLFTQHTDRFIVDDDDVDSDTDAVSDLS